MIFWAKLAVFVLSLVAARAAFRAKQRLDLPGTVYWSASWLGAMVVLAS